MKVKALLFALAAMVGMTAAAGTPPTSTKFYGNNVTIENATDKAILEICLESPDQPDLSFIQFCMTIPEGFSFTTLSEKEALGEGKDKQKEYIPAEIADDADWTLSANWETGAFMYGSTGNTPLDEDDWEGSGPVLYLAIQAAESGAKLAAGTYEIAIHDVLVSGGNTDQSLYGQIADSSFTLTVQNGDTPTAVTDINAKAVAGVKYYNLAGVESDMPFDGVNVVVTTYTDGTKAASKVIK